MLWSFAAGALRLGGPTHRTSFFAITSFTMGDEDPYKDLDQEQYDRILVGILDEGKASALLSVAGVYEAVREEFNNEVLKRWENCEEPKPAHDDQLRSNEVRCGACQKVFDPHNTSHVVVKDHFVCCDEDLGVGELADLLGIEYEVVCEELGYDQ